MEEANKLIRISSRKRMIILGKNGEFVGSFDGERKMTSDYWKIERINKTPSQQQASTPCILLWQLGEEWKESIPIH
jgi:hypothetical protein